MKKRGRTTKARQPDHARRRGKKRASQIPKPAGSIGVMKISKQRRIQEDKEYNHVSCLSTRLLWSGAKREVALSGTSVQLRRAEMVIFTISINNNKKIGKKVDEDYQENPP